jgi:GTP-binding protein
MIDIVKLTLQAGAGGNGRVSFRREKYIPKGGPDGGQGGDGGSIILRVNPKLTTLHHLAGTSEFVASSGQAGGKRSKTGSKGEDKIIEVPRGTSVWLLTENQVSHRRRSRYGLNWKVNRSDVRFDRYYLEKEGQFIPEPPFLDELEKPEKIDLKNLASLKKLASTQLIELTEPGAEVVISQGGFGGRGNESFKASNNTTPLEAEYGTPGEAKTVLLELKLLADIGLIGFPNAGKSTLLSRLTEAKPKIANYPFTTLEPQLGVLRVGSGEDARELVVADIPGLIEGAHAGKGLGFTFLRHLEHCQMLVYVLFLEDEVVLDEALTVDEKLKRLQQQYQALRQELTSYDDQLLHKKSLLTVNKIDIYSKELLDTLKSGFDGVGDKPLLISGYTGEGLDQLRHELLHS